MEQKDGQVEVDRNDSTWNKNVQARYFLFQVHVSKQFLLTTSLASALYVLVLWHCAFYHDLLSILL